MPTFFGRRYLRKVVPRVEVVWGVALLLMTAGVAGAFLTALRPGDRKLFELHPESLRGEGDSVDARRAAATVPAPPAPWRQAMPLEWSRGAAAQEWFAGDADAFQSHGFVSAWRGAYEAPGHKNPIRVRIADMGTPDGAAAILAARRPASATTAEFGRSGWSVGNRAAFWNGRYYTEVEAVSPADAKGVAELATAMAAAQLSYGPASAASGAADGARSASPSSAGPARFPAMTGAWRSPAAVKRFNKDTLYEKIDGKASVFFSYLFVELEFGTYQRTDTDWLFDVYVYDMGAPVNAFGVYRMERSPEAEVRALGREGYTSGASVFFWKGRYYVNVLGPPDAEGAARPAEELAAAIEKVITDDGTPLWAETAFPSANRKKGSLSYKATDALGYGFLQRVFLSEYAVDGKTYQLFLTRAADGKALFDQYAEAVKQYNKVLTRRPVSGGELIVSEALGVFEAAFYKGVLLGGVTECDDATLAEKQAVAFCEGLDEAAIASTVAAPEGPSTVPAAEPVGGAGGEAVYQE